MDTTVSFGRSPTRLPATDFASAGLHAGASACARHSRSNAIQHPVLPDSTPSLRAGVAVITSGAIGGSIRC